MLETENDNKMKIERECANKKCAKLFEPKRTDQLYCSDSCKVSVYRKRKSLGQVQQTKVPATMKPQSLTPPEPLNASAQFIIDELTRQRNKYENQVTAHEAEIKKLREEKIQLEKERDKFERELNEKPSGLAGFFSNSENVSKTVEQIPTVIAGVVELVKSMRSESGTQMGQLPAQKEHDLIVWLKQQTPTIQQGFIDIVKGFIKYPERTEEFISYFLRSMMNAGVNVNEQTGT